jgi:predicted RNase H-like HicB family nuclease|nr:MAG TPA: hypothetical protein [Caudoviricetes sp.]
MKGAYPVLIKEYGSDYLVYVPDMEIYTEGKSVADAMEMARDAIGLKGMDYLEDNVEFPMPSDKNTALQKAKDDADEDFDYSDGILTLVDVDFEEYKKRMQNRAVKKNCTIPYWMSVEADKVGINYSRVLQEALMNLIGKSAKGI